MANNEDITIKVSVDTSDAVDGFKDMEKASDKMAKNVSKDGDKIEKSLDDVTKSAKDIQTAFKKIDMKSLISTLSNIEKQISSLANSIKKQLTDALNVKGTVDAKVNMTTEASGGASGASGSAMSNMMSSAMTGGAMGAMLNKAQSLKHEIADTGENFKSFIGKQKELIKNFQKAVKENRAFKKTMENIDNYAAELVTHSDYIDGSFINMTLNVDNLSTVMKDFRKNVDIKDILQANTMKLGDARKVANELYNVFTHINGIESSANFSGSYSKELEMIEELQFHLSSMSKGFNFGKKIIPQDTLQQLQQLVSIAGQLTSRLNIFKVQTLEAFDSIQSKCPLIGKALNVVVKGIDKVVHKAKEIKQAFKQGFSDPQPYIDKMKAKITEWSNKHKQATDKVKKTNKSLSTSFKSLLSSMLPFASIYGIFNGLKTSITSYVNSLQQGGKFATTFGNETKEMTEWLDKLNSTVTTSKSELMNFSGNLYRMGRNMGVATDDAMAMSKSMTELGADLVAFTGDANSMDALAGALRGEYDSLQNYGYSLSASAVEARALAMGLDTASESALMFARQSLILEQSADILGYASGQAKTLGGQLAMLRKNFQSLGTAIGSCFAGLLQVVLPVLNAIVSAVTVAFNKLASIINSIFALFGIKVGGSASGGGAIGNAIGGITDSLGGGLSDAAGGAGDVADNLGSAADSAKEIQKSLMGIDEINNLSTPDNSSSGGSGGSGGAGGAGGGGLAGLGGLDFTQQESAIDMMMGELTDFQKTFLEVFEHIKQGFMVFKDEIIKQWSMLKINIDKLGQAMADFFVSCWEHGLSNCVILIGGIVGSIGVTALKIANSVTQVVTGIFEHLNPNNNENTQLFIDALYNLLLAVQGFIIDVGNWFSQFNEQAQPFYNNLADIGLIIGTIAMQLGADVIQLVRDFMNSWLGQELIEGVCDALERFSGLIESALGFVRDNLSFFEALGTSILVAYGAFNLINGVINIWNGLATVFASIGAICSGVVSALSGAIAFLASPIGIAVGVIGALVAVGVLLYKNWDTIKAKCKEVWDAVVQWFNEAGVDIEAIVGFIWEKVSNAFQRVWDVISTIMQNIWNVLVTVWNAILEVVTVAVKGVWNIIKSTFETVSAFIQLVLSIIVGIFTGEWDACYNMTAKFLLNLVEHIETVFTSVWEFIKTVLSGILDIFVEIWNGALDILTTTLNNMYDGVKDKFDTVIEFLTGIVERIKDIFNFEWSLPKPKLPKINWSLKDTGFMGLQVPTFDITWNAKGGIFDSPTIFNTNRGLQGVGEKGSEAILPLDTLWKEMNKNFDRQTETLAKLNNNNNNNQQTTLVLQLDGKEIARGTFQNASDLARIGQLNLDWL